jgi:hypothetical protein
LPWTNALAYFKKSKLATAKKFYNIDPRSTYGSFTKARTASHAEFFNPNFDRLIEDKDDEFKRKARNQFYKLLSASLMKW